MTTSSVSKGCFVFKPDLKKRKRTVDIEEYFVDADDDCSYGRERFSICRSLWEKIKTDTEILQDELNKKILDSLLEFIKKCTSSFQCRSDEWSCLMRASEIPTAALVLGVNVPDHDMTFQSLSDLLQESVTPFAVSVQAKECSALKNLMQKLLERLMGVRVTEEEYEEDPSLSGVPLQQKRVSCSIGALCQWYKAVTNKHKHAMKSPGKYCSLENDVLQCPPIVVIFKDFEAFNPHVLQDFIFICSRYIQELPLLLVFGIATSPCTIQHMLPHSVSSLLCIELFQSLSCTQHLATVIDKLILTAEFPFKLSGKVLQVLVNIFLYHDFSVRNFVKGLQLALLEHFHSQPLSVLCCKKKHALLNAQKLSHQHLEMLRQLPSFMRYVEAQEPQEQVQLLTSDKYVKEVCQKLLKDIRKYHKNYYCILRCLSSLTSSLPKYPLGKHIRELHMSCLERNIWETNEYESAIQLLRLLAKDELVATLKKCADILKPCKTKKMNSVLQQLEDYIVKLEHLDSMHVEDVSEGITPLGKDLQKKTDLFHLQKTLLEMKGSRRTKKMTPFEMLKNEALDFIDCFVRSHLSPPELQPLHEVCYYSSSGFLRQHLNATPRTSIQTALSQPFYYLQNENLKTDAGTVSSSAPDICIVYKLHLECGRLINLYDWLEAYATVVSGAEGKDPDSEEYGKVDELKHARFIKAVSELEFLGFVKSTKQKTDHVARLTWGGC
ncbi:origin recognition complex subunit 3 isoform X1 [Electrophorus electricus]|uniref:origin recognition complex subunit 3 isoform X1 n=1 Tax=Electrophorus electricus TaxID=8005 RepID=UPI0015D08C0D|nr:origin recognition complex subunit 3 isoform X1 [Electrophorus electricus]